MTVTPILRPRLQYYFIKQLLITIYVVIGHKPIRQLCKQFFGAVNFAFFNWAQTQTFHGSLSLRNKVYMPDRPLTENGLTKCHYTPALSRALPFRSKVRYVRPDGSGAMFTDSVTASALTCPDSLPAGKTGYSPFHCLFLIRLPYNIAQSLDFVNKQIGLLPVLC